jgi:hypothetical protein
VKYSGGKYDNNTIRPSLFFLKLLLFVAMKIVENNKKNCFKKKIQSLSKWIRNNKIKSAGNEGEINKRNHNDEM